MWLDYPYTTGDLALESLGISTAIEQLDTGINFDLT